MQIIILQKQKNKNADNYLIKVKIADADNYLIKAKITNIKNYGGKHYDEKDRNIVSHN